MDHLYNVTGEVDRQFYRITNVPILLLVALLGIIISVLLVTALVVATMKTWIWKTFRQVDITRLVVDYVGADLANGDSTFSRLRRASDDELVEWPGMYRVGYEKVFDAQNMDGEGHPSVRLRHTTDGDMEKSAFYETVRSVEQPGYNVVSTARDAQHNQAPEHRNTKLHTCRKKPFNSKRKRG